MRAYYLTPDGRTGCLVWGFARTLDDALDLVARAATEHRVMRLQSFDAKMPDRLAKLEAELTKVCLLGTYNARLEEVRHVDC